MTTQSQRSNPQQITRFSLLRHGRTVWNEQRRLQGRGDSPLTDSGRQLVGIWAEQLKENGFARIIASDLGRVKETVCILNRVLDLPVHFDSRLQEQSWGDWEGLSLAEIREEQPDILEQQIEAGWDFNAPRGESRQAVKERVFTAFDEFHRRYPGEHILIVCHQAVINCTLYHLAGRLFMPYEPKLVKKGYMHEIIREQSGFKTSQLNIRLAKESDLP